MQHDPSFGKDKVLGALPFGPCLWPCSVFSLIPNPSPSIPLCRSSFHLVPALLPGAAEHPGGQSGHLLDAAALVLTLSSWLARWTQHPVSGALQQARSCRVACWWLSSAGAAQSPPPSSADAPGSGPVFPCTTCPTPENERLEEHQGINKDIVRCRTAWRAITAVLIPPSQK